MKKFSKIVAIIAGCALVLGGILCLGVGIYTDFRMDRFILETDRANLELVDIALDFEGEINSIDFTFGDADVIIKEGTEFSLKASGIIKDDLTSSQKGKTLTIRQKSQDRWLAANLFNFGWWFSDNGWGFGPINAKIEVTYPAGTVFEEASLGLGVGNTEIYNLKADKASISIGVGNSDFYDLELRNASIDGGVGNTSFIGSSIDGLRCSVGVGNFDFDGTLSGNVTVGGGVGNASISGLLTGDTEINAGVGDIDLMLQGNPDDYDFDVEGGLGDVSFNGRKNSFPGNTSAANRISIEGGVGSVDVKMAAII